MSIIQLSLQGDRFVLRSDSFDRFPNSLLYAMFQDRDMAIKPSIRDGDCWFFDRDPVLFRRVILPFYQHGLWTLIDDYAPEIIYSELSYWCLTHPSPPLPGDIVDHPITNTMYRFLDALAKEPSYGTLCLWSGSPINRGCFRKNQDLIGLFSRAALECTCIALVHGYDVKFKIIPSNGTESYSHDRAVLWPMQSKERGKGSLVATLPLGSLPVGEGHLDIPMGKSTISLHYSVTDCMDGKRIMPLRLVAENDNMWPGEVWGELRNEATPISNPFMHLSTEKLVLPFLQGSDLILDIFVGPRQWYFYRSSHTDVDDMTRSKKRILFHWRKIATS